MNSDFALVDGLAKKPFIADLELCKVLLEPKRDFPWVLLVPRVSGVTQINQLLEPHQLKLYNEINLISNIMESSFPCERLNVAAIGNMTPQLHIHIICRTKFDPLFPDVVWNKNSVNSSDDEIIERIEIISSAIKKNT